MSNKTLKILLIFLLAYNLINWAQTWGQGGQVANRKFRIINLEKIENCDETEKLPMYFTSVSLKKPAINKLELYGDLVVDEIIKGPLYLTFTAYRCDIGLTNCNNYNEFKVPQICAGIHMKNILWSPMMEQVKPPMACPFQIGNYTLRNGTWDFAAMMGIPLEGYRWLLWTRLYDESGKKPHKVFCLKTTTYVTFGRRSSARK